MHIFLVVDIVLIVLALICNDKNKKIIFFISSCLLLLLTGFHDGTGDPYGLGYDFPHYLDFFHGNAWSGYGNLNNIKDYNLELPYFFMCKFLRLFGNYDFVYIFGCSLIYGLPFLYIVKKESFNPALSIFLLLTCLNTSIYLFFLAAHRQMLANTFLVIAYIIYEYKARVKWRGLLIVLLLFLSITAHSSSFFVVPLFITVIFFRKVHISFFQAFFSIIISILIGLFVSKFLNDYVMAISLLLVDSDEVYRSVNYVVNEIYDNQVVNLNTLLPLSILTSFFAYFQNEKEHESLFFKFLLVGVCLYNIFSFLPLINRGVLIFIIMGIAGSIPQKVIMDSYCKRTMLLLMIMFIYLAINVYASRSFRLLPFYFIWEKFL